MNYQLIFTIVSIVIFAALFIPGMILLNKKIVFGVFSKPSCQKKLGTLEKGASGNLPCVVWDKGLCKKSSDGNCNNVSVVTPFVLLGVSALPLFAFLYLLIRKAPQ